MVIVFCVESMCGSDLERTPSVLIALCTPPEKWVCSFGFRGRKACLPALCFHTLFLVCVDARRWVGHLIFNLTVDLLNISKFSLFFVRILIELLSIMLFLQFLFWFCSDRLSNEHLRWISCSNFLIYFVRFIVCNLGICAFVFVDQNTTPLTNLQLQYNQLLETTNLLHFTYLILNNTTCVTGQVKLPGGYDEHTEGILWTGEE